MAHSEDPNYTIMSYSLAILRGLAVETEAQELFPSMGRSVTSAAAGQTERNAESPPERNAGRGVRGQILQIMGLGEV